MTQVKSKIPLDAQSHYPKSWHTSQEDLNAYDDLQRKKLNYQRPEYVEDGELICFGLSEHQVEEMMPEWSEKATRDLTLLSQWFPRTHQGFEDTVTRPVYRSDFNFTNYTSRAQLRVVLGLLVIRELPIKNFYARCWLAYFWVIYFVVRGLGRGFRRTRPLVTYNHGIHAKTLVNYPDLFYWNLCKIIPTNPVTPDPHLEWRTRQTPIFHQYHKNAYRYRHRQPRYLPWDGTTNQPVMPYLVDTGSDVINGTFKLNCNSSPQLK